MLTTIEESRVIISDPEIRSLKQEVEEAIGTARANQQKLATTYGDVAADDLAEFESVIRQLEAEYDEALNELKGLETDWTEGSAQAQTINAAIEALNDLKARIQALREDA